MNIALLIEQTGRVAQGVKIAEELSLMRLLLHPLGKDVSIATVEFKLNRPMSSNTLRNTDLHWFRGDAVRQLRLLFHRIREEAAAHEDTGRPIDPSILTEDEHLKRTLRQAETVGRRGVVLRYALDLIVQNLTEGVQYGEEAYWFGQAGARLRDAGEWGWPTLSGKRSTARFRAACRLMPARPARGSAISPAPRRCTSCRGRSGPLSAATGRWPW